MPLAAEHSVGIAIFSYNGLVTFGVITDSESTPDIDVLAPASRGASMSSWRSSRLIGTPLRRRAAGSRRPLTEFRRAYPTAEESRSDRVSPSNHT